MLITNIETLPGKAVLEHFGLVSGSTIRAKHIGRDLMAGLKNLVGGELKGYTQLLATAAISRTGKYHRGCKPGFQRMPDIFCVHGQKEIRANGLHVTEWTFTIGENSAFYIEPMMFYAVEYT